MRKLDRLCIRAQKSGPRRDSSQTGCPRRIVLLHRTDRHSRDVALQIPGQPDRRASHAATNIDHDAAVLNLADAGKSLG